jgi:hypothetical protein
MERIGSIFRDAKNQQQAAVSCFVLVGLLFNTEEERGSFLRNVGSYTAVYRSREQVSRLLYYYYYYYL